MGTARQHLETTAPYAGARVGVRYFLSARVASEVGVGWTRVWYEEDFGDTTDDVSFNVGVSFLF